MYNPFYKAELNMLYPHRTTTTSKQEAKAHLKSLIKMKYVSLEQILSMKIKAVQNDYLLNINQFEVLEILEEIKNNH